MPEKSQYSAIVLGLCIVHTPLGGVVEQVVAALEALVEGGIAPRSNDLDLGVDRVEGKLLTVSDKNWWRRGLIRGSVPRSGPGRYPCRCIRGRRSRNPPAQQLSNCQHTTLAREEAKHKEGLPRI